MGSIAALRPMPGKAVCIRSSHPLSRPKLESNIVFFKLKSWMLRSLHFVESPLGRKAGQENEAENPPSGGFLKHTAWSQYRVLDNHGHVTVTSYFSAPFPHDAHGIHALHSIHCPSFSRLHIARSFLNHQYGSLRNL